jgi:hypothetical protein
VLTNSGTEQILTLKGLTGILLNKHISFVDHCKCSGRKSTGPSVNFNWNLTFKAINAEENLPIRYFDFNFPGKEFA